MFKKTNPQENPQQPKRAGRVRMDTLSTSPKLHDVRMVLVEAQRNKGTLCELPIRTPQGIFLLSCQSDHLSPEPCWTLYEGADGSAQMWSYMNEDLEMITDIINMSISQKAPSSEVNDAFNEVKNTLKTELDAKAADEYKPWGAYAQQPAQQPPAQSWPGADQSNSQWPGADQSTSQWPNQQPVQQQPPAQQWPATDPGAGQWPVTPGGFPGQAPQQAPQQQWPGAAPQQQWPGAAPQAPYPELQGQPQQWPAAPQQAPYIDPAQQQSQWPGVGASAMPYPELAPQQPQSAQAQETSIWKNQSAGGTTGGGSSMSKFIKFLESQKNLTIGEVLFAPDLPPACSDSAMRLQEMVCKSEISDKQAIDALKLAAEKGSGIVDESILGQIRQRSQASAGAARATVTMLKDSGIITEADANAAEMKAEKEGKDIAETLIAMGKSDKLMVDNAAKCVEYVNDGKIRPDQAIIALNYCMRARSPIDQAFDDLSIDVK